MPEERNDLVPCTICGVRRAQKHANAVPKPCITCRNLHAKFLAEPLGPWVEDAACTTTDPEAFFPPPWGEGYEVDQVRMVKRICINCPVRMECLTYAFRYDVQDGIWGGLDAYERRKLKRKHQQAKQQRRRLQVPVLPDDDPQEAA